jgi:hypothetical protein
MRAFGLIGLLIALAITALLVVKQTKAPVNVPVAVPNSTGAGVTAVPMHQAASQVQQEVNAVVQQQAQQMTQALGGAASDAER